MDRDPLSVLLVDDEGFFISLIASQLHDEYGYKVDTGFTGKEAVEKIANAKRAYDVILLDYMMPEMSGLNVLQWMHEQKNETPVVMLTAAGSENVAVEAMKMGAYDYLRKEHIDVQRLAIIIQATHERRQFRIARELEIEKEREIKLNLEATEKVRRILNTLSPRLNEDFAAIGVELDLRTRLIRNSLPEEVKSHLDDMTREIRTHVASIENGVKGLLSLYKVMYARHSEEGEIENIRGEVEKVPLASKSEK
ncbi:MAG: response regulator [Ignavibacteriales bacterium]|nr:response regulator [Ignavibacteriales bacterium]